MTFAESRKEQQRTVEGDSSPTPKSPFKALHSKAMLVKLTCSAPNLSHRDAQAETFVQDQLKDTSLVVSSKLFKSKGNAVRRLLYDASEIYAYHISHTMPWTDRGPRLLPVSQYHVYSEEMRKRIRTLENATAKLLPRYPDYVNADIAARGDRAKLTDYPNQEEFKASLAFTFFFSPLPDKAHFLFDIDKEDAASLEQFIDAAGAEARTFVFSQMKEPLVHLVNRLKVKIGNKGSIFREASINNIVEACALVESMAMGDDGLLNAAAELRTAVRPLTMQLAELRESPKSRTAAVKKLEEVAAKMSFMSGE